MALILRKQWESVLEEVEEIKKGHRNSKAMTIWSTYKVEKPTIMYVVQIMPRRPTFPMFVMINSFSRKIQWIFFW